MATTSSILAPGGPATGQGSGGMHHGRRTAGLVVSAALGLALLVGGLLGHTRRAADPSAGPSGAPPARIIVALGDRDDARFGAALPTATVPHVVVALGDRDDPRFGR